MQAFLDAVQNRGMGALELVAMDMKARGMYVCRTLSFKGEAAPEEVYARGYHIKGIQDSCSIPAGTLPSTSCVAAGGLTPSELRRRCCLLAGWQAPPAAEPP